MSLSPGPLLRSPQVAFGWIATCCSEPWPLQAGAKVVTWLRQEGCSQPTSPISDRLSQRRIRATLATSSNTGSPVRLLRVANSTMKVPIPAVQVTGVSPGFTPWSRFTVPYGMPVGVWKAEQSQNYDPSQEQRGRDGWIQSWSLRPWPALPSLFPGRPTRDWAREGNMSLSGRLSQMLANTAPHDPRALARDEEESRGCPSRLSHATHAHFRYSSTIFTYFTLCLQKPGRQLSVKQAQLRPWGVGGLWHPKEHAPLEATEILFNFFFQFYWDMVDIQHCIILRYIA